MRAPVKDLAGGLGEIEGTILAEGAAAVCRVPVQRPQLPSADALIPYLRRMDASRIYSNYGPLALELEARLASEFNQGPGSVVTAASGLAALVGAILTRCGRGRPDKPYALIPAYTFIATAAAAEHCGYVPYLVDIDAESWALDPRLLRDHPALGQTGVVIPVATLGRPVGIAAWQEFGACTGIPVVVDGAASFEGLRSDPAQFVGAVPVALSFHATKSFATGEGGCVISSDAELIRRVASTLNFGLHTGRDCQVASTNGKLSEYHAAVGLAELDGWRNKQASASRVVQSYRQHFSAHGLSRQLYSAPQFGSSYALYLAEDQAQAQAVCAQLEAAGIDFRFWYGRGIHGQSYYANLLHRGLGVTDELAPRLIGLPFAVDLPDLIIARIAAAVASGANKGSAA